MMLLIPHSRLTGCAARLSFCRWTALRVHREFQCLTQNFNYTYCSQLRRIGDISTHRIYRLTAQVAPERVIGVTLLFWAMLLEFAIISFGSLLVVSCG